MGNDDLDTLMRVAAFEHLRMLGALYPHLTHKELAPGFMFRGERIPLMNPQRGIFKPRQMRLLLSIKTVFPRAGGRVWYDDQRHVHRQIFDADDRIDYAFMGQNPDAADNRCLREAFENRIPLIYFLGISLECYQAVFPSYIVDWDAGSLKANVAFGVAEHTAPGRPTAFDGLRSTRAGLRWPVPRIQSAASLQKSTARPPSHEN